MAEPFVNLDNTKHRPTGEYGKAIAQIGKDGVCPFCPEHLAKYHANPIIDQTDCWALTKNAYPYKGAQHHFLLIHKDHIEDFPQLSPKAWQELQALVNKTLKTHDIKGGALVFRFGETKYTGASVTHLHAQLVVGPGVEGAEPVLMRVG